MLTARQERFVFEYCKDFVATRAYVRAGYSEAGAGSGGPKLLENPEVQAAIEEQKEMLAYVATLSPAWVLRQWMDIASANPNDLVSIEVDSCPECYDQDTRTALVAGGLGDTLKIPNPACAACKGRGIESVRVADTRRLKGAAKRLYAGAVMTRDGVKVLMRDQDAALANLSKYLGMVVDRKEIAVPGANGEPLKPVRAEDLTDDQLAALISAGSSNLELSDGNSGVDSGVYQDTLGATVIDAIT